MCTAGVLKHLHEGRHRLIVHSDDKFLDMWSKIVRTGIFCPVGGRRIFLLQNLTASDVGSQQSVLYGVFFKAKLCTGEGDLGHRAGTDVFLSSACSRLLCSGAATKGFVARML